MEISGIFEGMGTLAAAVVGALALLWTTSRVEKNAAAREKEARKEDADRQARYIAMRTVVILDRLVNECAETSLDEGEPEGRHGELVPRTSSPSIDFPENIDWRWIRADLMYRALAIPQEIEAASDSLSFISENVAGPPNYEEWFEERIIRFAGIGLEASRLARAMRDAYEIPARRQDGWSPSNTMNRAFSDVEKKRAERRKAQQKSMAIRAEGPAVALDEKVMETSVEGSEICADAESR